MYKLKLIVLSLIIIALVGCRSAYHRSGGVVDPSTQSQTQTQSQESNNSVVKDESVMMPANDQPVTLEPVGGGVTSNQSGEIVPVTSDTMGQNTSGQGIQENPGGAENIFVYVTPNLLMRQGGYRSADDPCRRVGETDAVRNYLSDSDDLVGCPESYNEAEFINSFHAWQVGLIDGYRLISVPR